MSETILGVDFDIHGGGIDLVFPHHENECAQTYAGRGKPLARIWMHNGMLRFSGEKMSKSLGNIMALHEALDQYSAPTLVMYFVSGHYRAPIECTPETLGQAAANVDRLKELVARLGDGEDAALDEAAGRFFDHLADDFNTPAAMAEVFSWVREANRRLDGGEPVGGLERLREVLTVVGLESVFEAGDEEVDAAAAALLEAREAARAAKDFGESDRLRDELLAMGWEIRDTADGPVLRRSS
jgi:cysteinyl-tRNA synthetase